MTRPPMYWGTRAARNCRMPRCAQSDSCVVVFRPMRQPADPILIGSAREKNAHVRRPADPSRSILDGSIPPGPGESRFLSGQDGSGIHPGRHQSILGVRTYTAWTAPRASNDSYCDSDCDLIHPTRFLVDYVFVSNLTRNGQENFLPVVGWIDNPS